MISRSKRNKLKNIELALQYIKECEINIAHVTDEQFELLFEDAFPGEIYHPQMQSFIYNDIKIERLNK